MEWYRPGAVVLQCGADSLAGDRLGCFNLSHLGHARCVEFVKKFGLPTLVLGGGGYTIRNVARCWAYETALLVDRKLSEDIPYNEYFEYYGPDYKMSVPRTNMENLNSKEYLHKIRTRIIENLRHCQFAPSMQTQDVPRDLFSSSDTDSDNNEDVDADPKRDRLEDFDFSFDSMRARLVNREFQPDEDDQFGADKADQDAIRAMMREGASAVAEDTKDLTARFENLESLHDTQK